MTAAVENLVEPPRRRSLQRLGWMGALAVPLLGASCGGGGDGDGGTPSGGGGGGNGVTTCAAGSGTGGVAARFTTLNQTLAAPWGMDFLPDGRIVVTQKAGSIVILSADGVTKSAPLSNVPTVFSDGQGGLLDVAVDPDFATAGSNWIYFSYSESGTGGAGTAVARARLSGTTLSDVEVIFRQAPKVAGSAHFGSRLVFRPDKTLFITLGERQAETPAQNLATTLGKVVRINRDGSIPPNNPSFGVAGTLPGIWTYGHRNPQGAALNPATGELWVGEHGPQGGDEINIAKPGRNFGWPSTSYGCEYSATNVTPECRKGGTRGVHTPNYVEPVTWWPAPSTAPAGMIFYTGNEFPEWRGNLLVGALSGQTLWRLVLDGEACVSQGQVFPNMNLRIRDVAQGPAPEGRLYLLTDSGRLIRVER